MNEGFLEEFREFLAFVSEKKYNVIKELLR